MGVVLVYATMLVLFNLAVDVLYLVSCIPVLLLVSLAGLSKQEK